ncbi:putative Diguanylate cyclase [Candidatus Terasakiella magnetica]|nr:putative Diguanylate cyclase [Candidatus Terasakiella magnetica]
MVTDKQRQALALAQVGKQAELSRVTANLIHELQRERGASAILLGGEGSFTTVLAAQRPRTETFRSDWELYAARVKDEESPPELAATMALARTELTRLDTIRWRVDDHTIAVRTANEYYTNTIHILLNVVTQVGKASVSPDVANAINGYVSFMRGKEMLGQERAIGAAPFAHGAFEPDQLLHFSAVQAQQASHFATFKDYASPALVDEFARFGQSQAMTELTRLRNLAVSVPADRRFETPGGAAWFHASTRAIDALKSIADKIEDDLIERCAAAEATAIHARDTTIGIATLLLLAMAWFTHRITASLSGPLIRTRQTLAALSAGDTEVKLDAADFPGEFKGILNALEVFRTSRIATRTLTAEITQARDQLRLANVELEDRVQTRTFELNHANQSLRREMEERSRAEDGLRLAASVFHNTIEGIMITDMDGTILSVNPAFTTITGYSAEEAVGQTPRLLKSDHHDSAFYASMWKTLDDTAIWQGEIWNRRKSGEAFLEWLSISVVPDIDGRPLRYVSVFNDITELWRKDEHIRHQAYHDALTGLPNRFLLQDRLEHALDIARRARSALAVLFLDLDRFKLINDSLGHEMGDHLLRAVAGRISDCVRKSDTVARLGGDEFVVVLSDPSGTDEVAHTAERIITALAIPLLLAGRELQVTSSIGIAMFPQDGREANALMKNADTAMYQAKDCGRNAFRFFDSGMNNHAIERLDMEVALRHALANNEFELHYQPKLRLPGSELNGFEALIRWNRPGHGLIAPGDFIPLAEETGLIIPIGQWVLETACRQMAIWRQAALPIGMVAVNLSARQFQDPQLLENIAGILATSGLPPQSLELELTESTVMANPAQAAHSLDRLRQMGISIAVDDFGTGYSSLSYLKRLPIQTLKIDRSFIIDIGRNTEDEAIIETIVALGKALNLDLVAEGVETEAQAAFLASRGCGSAQGFLYSRPISATAMTAWLASRKPQSLPVI